jgi:hypothetical protein
VNRISHTLDIPSSVTHALRKSDQNTKQTAITAERNKHCEDLKSRFIMEVKQPTVRVI